MSLVLDIGYQTTLSGNSNGLKPIEYFKENFRTGINENLHI